MFISMLNKFLCAFATLVCLGQISYAQDLQIIEVRRNIPLADDAPVYKDFYLNGGTDKGLKKNQIVTVFRKITIRDALGAQVYGELSIPVGQLKVISVYNNLAVAREHNLISRDDEPMLEQIGIMSGDLIQLAAGR